MNILMQNARPIIANYIKNEEVFNAPEEKQWQLEGAESRYVSSCLYLFILLFNYDIDCDESKLIHRLLFRQ